MAGSDDPQSDNRWARLEDKVVFSACSYFIAGDKVEEIVNKLKRQYDETINRAQMRYVISEGQRRKYFHLTPPRDVALATWMQRRFGKPFNEGTEHEKERKVTVVTQTSHASLEIVTMAAAERLLEIIKTAYDRKLEEGKEDADKVVRVHVGFGAGASMKLTAQYLASLMVAMPSPPPIALHALSSGTNVRDAEAAPVTFFNFFPHIPPRINRGLFAAAYVHEKDWAATQGLVGVKEAREDSKEIDIIVTALASRDDVHGELNRFMDCHGATGRETRRILDKVERRIGDVLYRPYNFDGPILRDDVLRAVTLYEIDELVSFAARDDTSVVLVAGPCGDPDCYRSRDDALMPLLTNPRLAVWTDLITDDTTATACLGMSDTGAPTPTPAALG